MKNISFELTLALLFLTISISNSETIQPRLLQLSTIDTSYTTDDLEKLLIELNTLLEGLGTPQNKLSNNSTSTNGIMKDQTISDKPTNSGIVGTSMNSNNQSSGNQSKTSESAPATSSSSSSTPAAKSSAPATSSSSSRNAAASSPASASSPSPAATIPSSSSRKPVSSSSSSLTTQSSSSSNTAASSSSSSPAASPSSQRRPSSPSYSPSSSPASAPASSSSSSRNQGSSQSRQSKNPDSLPQPASISNIQTKPPSSTSSLFFAPLQPTTPIEDVNQVSLNPQPNKTQPKDIVDLPNLPQNQFVDEDFNQNRGEQSQNQEPEPVTTQNIQENIYPKVNTSINEKIDSPSLSINRPRDIMKPTETARNNNKIQTSTTPPITSTSPGNRPTTRSQNTTTSTSSTTTSSDKTPIAPVRRSKEALCEKDEDCKNSYGNFIGLGLQIICDKDIFACTIKGFF